MFSIISKNLYKDTNFINTLLIAFENNFEGETARILEDLQSRLSYLDMGKPLVIRDINGNVIGEMNLIRTRYERA